MKHWVLAILFLLFFVENTFSQNERRSLIDANETYRRQNFEDAELRYKNANPDNQRLKEIAAFNLADAQYRLGKFDEAAEGFGKLAMESQNPELQMKAYHNEGNSYISKKEYEKAVESYKNALRINPDAEDTRYNLAYARKMIQKQQQQQQQNQQNQQNQDQQKQDQQNQGQKQDDQKKQDQQKGNQDEQKEGSDPKQQDGDQGKQPKPGEEQGKEQISKEDAERILKALENAESDLQKKLRKPEGTAKKKKIEKDW